MGNPKRDAIAGFFDGLVQRYGRDIRSLDYGSPESQRIRFQVLAEALDLSGKSILDVGCGFADFADYLSTIYHDVEYVGVDLSPKMVATARQLHPHLDISVADILAEPPKRRFDMVTATGIFYLLGEDALPMMRALIERMFELSRDTIAFNSLSTWATVKEPGEFYADPVDTLNFCRSLTSHVVLRHDYLPHDFTIIMRKTPISGRSA